MSHRSVIVAAGIALLSVTSAMAQDGAAPAFYAGDPSVAEVRARAEAGDAEAQFHLAKHYMWGVRGIPCDRRAALPWLEKASAQGQKDAISQLKNEREYLARYESERAAAHTGDPQAQFQYGADLYKLRCFGDDWRDNMTWLNKAAKAGNAAAEAWFGDYYAYGYRYYLEFPQTARGNYPHYAANAGAKSLPRAIYWYKRAAADRHPHALSMLPILYGMDSPAKDLAAMEAWLTTAAYAPPPPSSQKTYTIARVSSLIALCRYYDLGTFSERSPIGYPISTEVSARPRPVHALACLENARLFALDVRAQLLMLEEIYRLARFHETGRGKPRDDLAAEALYREILAFENWVDDDPFPALAAMRLGLLLHRQGKATEAYYWLLRAPDTQSCPSDRFTDDEDYLCRDAATARDAIAAQLTPEERSQIATASR